MFLPDFILIWETDIHGNTQKNRKRKRRERRGRRWRKAEGRDQKKIEEGRGGEEIQRYDRSGGEEREGEIRRGELPESSHSLIPFRNVSSNSGLASSKPEAWELNQFPNIGGRIQLHELHLPPLRVHVGLMLKAAASIAFLAQAFQPDTLSP